MKTSTSIAALAAALAKAQGALHGAKKDSKNPAFNSTYADLESIVDALKAVFPALGLSYSQFPVTSAEGVGVETIILHESGEFLQSDPWYLPVQKANAHGVGSALTYARRYALAAACGIKASDDDGNAAAAAAPRHDPAEAIRSANISGAQVNADALAGMSPEEQDFIRTLAADVQTKGDQMHAYIEAQNLDAEEKLALWACLPSGIRSAIKKQARPALATQA